MCVCCVSILLRTSISHCVICSIQNYIFFPCITYAAIHNCTQNGYPSNTMLTPAVSRFFTSSSLTCFTMTSTSARATPAGYAHSPLPFSLIFLLIASETALKQIHTSCCYCFVLAHMERRLISILTATHSCKAVVVLCLYFASLWQKWNAIIQCAHFFHM